MKCKQIAALALSAVFSVGYLVAAALPGGRVVSAASVTVKSELEPEEHYVILKLSQQELNSLTAFRTINKLTFGDVKKYAPTGSYSVDGIKTSTAFNWTLPNTGIKKFAGWSCSQNSTTPLKDTDVVSDINGISVDLNNDTYGELNAYIGVHMAKQGVTVKFYPIYQHYESLKEYNEIAEADAKAAAEKAASEQRSSELNRRLWRNSAGSNVKYWWMEEETDSSGQKTGVTVRREGVKTAKPRAVLVTGDNSKFTTVYYSSAKDPLDGRMNLQIYEGVLNSVGISDPEHEMFFVYDVHWSSMDHIIGLLKGKQAQITLSFPNTDSNLYDISVYHVVYGNNIFRADEVKSLDIGSHDVSFYATSFSPYVVVMQPKDSALVVSAGAELPKSNPPTGDTDVLPVALLGAASLGVAALVHRKKQKENV